MRRHVALLGVCAAALLANPAYGQISPGPLATAHAELEGALNCVRCHGPKKGSMNASCLSCHREISWLVERKRGYHASPAVEGKRDCASCHPDHAGRDFALIEWPQGSLERFDHRSAGWALDGKHIEVKCRECHTPEYRTSPAARLVKRTTGDGWTGLETTCASCHANDDVHRGALRQGCDGCHDARDWKNAPRFSHDTTDYPLMGKHADAECNACHLAPRLPLQKDARGKPIPIYAPVPFRSCTNCHDDPHAGRLSQRCTECHSTQSFNTIEQRSFNHDLTRYPLKGRHGRVACASCHGADLATPKPAFDRCVSCHSDPHNGSAVLGGTVVDCDACHRADSFSPSTFSVARHASSPYPLEGRHAQVACVKCHAPLPASGGNAPRIARLRMPSARCIDCHAADAHGSQLAQRADRGACESCHAVAGWTPSTYSVAEHATVRLKLDGRHAEVPCRACHGATRPGLPAPTLSTLGSAKVAVVLAASACRDCHVDAHDGRYAPTGARPAAGSCTDCHSTSAFRPALVSADAHARLGFTLDGAHRAVACVACHEELRRPPATATLVLNARGVSRFPVSATIRSCATCHQNPHGDQFADRGLACESCHDASAFVPASRFDHERAAAFSLRGAHAKVPCTACHVARDVAGKRVTVYRPLSSRCESCHDRRRGPS